VDASAPRRQHADAPVAELVAHAFDENRSGVGHHACRRFLIVQVLQQVFSRELVEIVLACQLVDGGGRRQAQHLADQPSYSEAELERPSRLIALPERHFPRLAGSGGDQHAVVRDLRDPPGRCAETPSRRRVP
jgi:hypothetical protein